MKPYKTSQGNWQLNYTLSGRQHTFYLLDVGTQRLPPSEQQKLYRNLFYFAR